MELVGKVALVTGGAHRVGRALALGLARAGADVIVHYNASAAEAERTAGEVRTLGGHARTLQADFAADIDFRALIARVHREFGRLDVLVNSASIMERGVFEEVSLADWNRVLAINLRAPFFLSQAAAPLLAGQGGGLIVNIADLSAFQTWPSYVHHAVSKAGLVHLTRQLARALGPAVRVNGIAPGTVLEPEDRDEGDSAGGPDRGVVLRPGDPDDVVHALMYLVGNEFVTGQVLIVDGGRTLL